MANKKISDISEVVKNNVKEKETEISTHDIINNQLIQSRIYLIREQQIILDEDLAEMYGVETKHLKRQVNRNIERFPSDFLFQLTREEYNSLRCQNGTLENGRGNYSKYLPYAFTEQGISQLSGILRSPYAIEINIRIMRAFVAMRRFISANAGMFQRIEKLEQHQQLTDHKMEIVLQRMDELSPSITPEQIFATGCVWDAWNYVSQLIRSAKKRIILIDNFVDERVLTLLTKREKGVTATIHSRYSVQFNLDLEKHNEQYETVNFIQIPHKSHDRFLIIDDDVYLMGASVKDMGTSLCAITKMEISPDIVLTLVK